jgi:hypothetical protein
MFGCAYFHSSTVLPCVVLTVPAHSLELDRNLYTGSRSVFVFVFIIVSVIDDLH